MFQNFTNVGCQLLVQLMAKCVSFTVVYEAEHFKWLLLLTVRSENITTKTNCYCILRELKEKTISMVLFSSVLSKYCQIATAMKIVIK